MSPKEEPCENQDEQVVSSITAKEGDLAIFSLSGATGIMYQNENYVIVPQSAVLMLEREEDR